MEVAWQLVKNPLQTVSSNDNWPQLLKPFISPSGKRTYDCAMLGWQTGWKAYRNGLYKTIVLLKAYPTNKSFLMLYFSPSSALVLNFPFSTDQHKLKPNIGIERKDGESWPFPSGGQPQIPAVVWEMMSYSLETWLRSFSVTGKLLRRFNKGWNMSSFFFSFPFFINIVLDYVCSFFFSFNIVFYTKSQLCLVLFPLGNLTRNVPSSLHATTNISLPRRKGHITHFAGLNKFDCLQL